MPSAGKEHQRRLPFAELDPRPAGRLDYYPCASVTEGPGLIGPRGVARLQREERAVQPETPGLARGSFDAPTIWRHGSGVFDVRSYARCPMPRLEPTGLPLFSHYSRDLFGPGCWEERRYQAAEYLRRTDVVLNPKGRLKLLQGPHHRRKAGELLRGLFYHLPYQALDLCFTTIAERERGITRPTIFRLFVNHPRFGTSADNHLLGAAAVKWTAGFPHTREEVQRWIDQVRRRPVPEHRLRRNNAKWAAEFIAAGLRQAGL